MAGKDQEREKRLAAALRENLKRRKAQARQVLPGTGRGTATRSGVVEGAASEAQAPLHHASHDEQVRIAPRSEAMPGGHGDLHIPPRPGED